MAFSKQQIQDTWNRALSVEGYDPTRFRKDACGAWIQWSDYGNHNSQYGWDIDHVFPKALGGGDDEMNLRAMQWQNNLAKSDDFPYYFSAVIADDRRNADNEKQFKVNESLLQSLKQIYRF